MRSYRPVYVFLPGESVLTKMFTDSRESVATIRVLNGDGHLRVPFGSYAYEFEAAKTMLSQRWEGEHLRLLEKARLASRVIENLKNKKPEDVSVVDPRPR